jgi:hypothetical protein
LICTLVLIGEYQLLERNCPPSMIYAFHKAVAEIRIRTNFFSSPDM